MQTCVSMMHAVQTVSGSITHRFSTHSHGTSHLPSHVTCIASGGVIVGFCDAVDPQAAARGYCGPVRIVGCHCKAVRVSHGGRQQHAAGNTIAVKLCREARRQGTASKRAGCIGVDNGNGGTAD